MSWVILGGGGFFAGHLRDALFGAEVRSLPRAECDVTRPAQLADAVADAEVVVNCAGFTAVDRAEAEPSEAHRVNVDGAANVAHAAARAGALCVHLSTDFVFDGCGAPYSGDARPAPLSVYGRTKRMGELAALGAGGRLLIARVQALYAAGGRGFASRIAELLLGDAPLRLDDERRVQPTWAPIAASQLVVLAGSGATGLYHLSCAGGTTWAGFGRALAARLGVEPRFEAVPTAALSSVARRPADTRFDHSALVDRGIPVPTWEEGLDGYVATLRAAEGRR